VKLGFTVLEHPAYSPDLAPTGYHLFGPHKDALRGRRFTSDEGVKEAVHERLAAQPKTFFCGHPEASGALEQVYCKALGLY